MRHKISQWVLLAGALGVWSIWGVPIFAGPVLAYLAVWALCSRRALAWSGRAAAVAMALGIAAAVATVTLEAREIREAEQLTDLDVVLSDRWRLAELPAFAPPIVRADRPGTHYVFAPDARAVSLRFSGSNRNIPALSLGHGLFRAEIDPTLYGPISDRIAIDVDGEISERAVRAVLPTARPIGLTAGPDRTSACAVSNETDELFVLSREGAPSRLAVEDRPTDCAIIDADRIAVAHETGAIIFAGTSSRAVLGDGPLLHLAYDGEHLVAALSGPEPAIVVLSKTLTIERRIPLEFEPDRVASSPDGILVSSARTRSLYRLGNPQENAQLFFGRPVVAMALSIDGARLFAALTDYRPEDDAGPNHHLEDQLLEIDARTLRILRRVPTAPHASPYAIAVDSDRIAVAFVGSDEVLELDREDLSLRARHPIDRPTGAAYLAGGELAAASAANAVLLRGDARFELARPDPLLLAGERAFYGATRAGLSCQSCHLHGGSDYSLHDIGQGDGRPTLNPRGTSGTSPYLRGASYPSIAALEAFTTYVLGGYEELIPDRAVALQAYLDSLPRSPPPPPPAELAKGVDAFVAAGCTFCHRFPAFTDLAQYPEGFLFPERRAELHWLDTPSLLGVGDSAPYLYDGRARTLEAVLFDHNRARRHGDAASLSADEREALLRFLRSL